MFTESEKTKLYNRLLAIENKFREYTMLFVSKERFDKLILDLKGTRSANADSVATMKTQMASNKAALRYLAKELGKVSKIVDKLVAQRDKVKAKVEKKKRKKVSNRFLRALNEFKKS